MSKLFLIIMYRFNDIQLLSLCPTHFLLYKKICSYPLKLFNKSFYE